MNETAVIIIKVCIALTTALLLTLSGRRMYHISQLSSYRVRGVWNWLKKSRFDYLIRHFALAFLSFIAMYVYVACFGGYDYVCFLGYLLFVFFSVLFIVLTSRDKAKVPMRYTARMIRLHIASFVVNCLLVALTALIVSLTENLPLAPSYAFFGVLPLFTPFVCLLAQIITQPFETLNNYSYKVRARARLEMMPEMIRIGITGSYGKTTAKTMLAAMLEKKFKVCYSRKSYNTPMGICKVVNNDLPDDAQIFVAEMGARYVGDIKELTEIVRPNYGILTAIGNQHLETFGSLENIKNTKYELVENLYPGGLALFNGDSEGCRELYERTGGEKMITGALGTQGADVCYSDAKQSPDGVNFILHIGGKDRRVQTKLLGRHIPSVMTLCAALAYELGVAVDDIIEVCESMEPVPHRLELIRRDDKMVIIDDAYNANTAGAENALLALSGFEGYKKVIITPGLVELGDEEKQANTELGEKIGKVCDLALFVGERGVFLKDGAMKAGMNEDGIMLCASLDEAVAKLRDVTEKAAVLFENDLPDNY